MPAGLFSDLVDHADIRVIQRRRSFGFPPESLERERIVGKLVRQELERNVAVQN